jgi:hypothetical protein
MGNMKAETEKDWRAAQDQALQAKYHATTLLQRETQNKVWLSKGFGDTVQHISTSLLLKKNYILEENLEYVFTAC